MRHIKLPGIQRPMPANTLFVLDDVKSGMRVVMRGDGKVVVCHHYNDRDFFPEGSILRKAPFGTYTLIAALPHTEILNDTKETLP